jgi:DNA-binding response OmpR family regulator
MLTAVDTTRILVIEDSPDVLSVLEHLLGEQGWDVRASTNGEAGLAHALEHPPDLAIIDIGLPGRDGLEVTAELRRRGIDSPVLLLTARGSVADRVTGLDAGADDYLAKPFDSDELLARVRALLRRATRHGRGSLLRVGALSLDPLTREVARGARRISLTHREFALLEFFMRNADRPLTRQEIAEDVWQTELDLEATNIVDVYVAYLRKKIDGDDDEPILQTVRGIGYVLRSQPGGAEREDE